MEYLSEIFSAVCALLIYYWQRQQKKRDKAQEARAEVRKRESLLPLELSMATGKMCAVLIEKLQNHELNGNVEDAKEAYEQARSKHLAFLNEQATEHLQERR